MENFKEMQKKVMSELGKKSAKARKSGGHDSEYYRKLARKRWNKRPAIQEI